MIDPDQLNPLIKILPHVVRNAIDHCLESPAERQDKNPAGSLRIIVKDLGFAEWQIVIQDDGRGIDEERIVAKAVALGLIPPERVKKLSKAEKLHLIFLPELSTAESVTDISGRGIGMATVEQAVHDLGGNIAVESTKGRGTSFVFTIPKKKPLESARRRPNVDLKSA